MRERIRTATLLGLSLLPAATGCVSSGFVRPGDESSRNGDAAYFKGEYTEAASHYALSVSRGVKNGYLFYQLADCYLHLGEEEKAREHARRAVETFTEEALRPQGILGFAGGGPPPLFHLYLGEAYRMLGRPDKAAFVFAKALGQAKAGELGDLEEGEELAALARIAGLEGDRELEASHYRRALEAFSRAEREGSDRLNRVTYAGVCYWSAQAAPDHVSARQLLEKALALYPGHVDAALALGRRLVEDREWKSGLELYRRLVGIAPENGAAWAGLAECALMSGRRDEASRAATRALELSPGDARALYLKGWVLAAQGRLEESLRFLERSVERLPGSLAPYLRLGALLVWQGKLTRAVSVYRVAGEVFAASPVPRFHLAQAYELQSRRVEAARAWEAFLEKAPEFSHAGLARDKIAALRGGEGPQGEDPLVERYARYRIELP